MKFRTFLLPLVLSAAAGAADAPARIAHRLLAASKTSTMEREMNRAAAEGFTDAASMGGETALGGNEVVVVMSRDAGAPACRRYRLLTASMTSTMQKEMQAAAREGFHYCGQTVFDSKSGGREVAVIMELDPDSDSAPTGYLLLATQKTSTMQKQLEQTAGAGYRLLGLTVAKTAFGGGELVSILARTAAK